MKIHVHLNYIYNISLQVLHEKVHDQVVAGLVKAYKQLRVGDPLDGKLLDSPLSLLG